MKSTSLKMALVGLVVLAGKPIAHPLAEALGKCFGYVNAKEESKVKKECVSGRDEVYDDLMDNMGGEIKSVKFTRIVDSALVPAGKTYTVNFSTWVVRSGRGGESGQFEMKGTLFATKMGDRYRLTLANGQGAKVLTQGCEDAPCVSLRGYGSLLDSVTAVNILNTRLATNMDFVTQLKLMDSRDLEARGGQEALATMLGKLSQAMKLQTQMYGVQIVYFPRGVDEFETIGGNRYCKVYYAQVTNQTGEDGKLESKSFWSLARKSPDGVWRFLEIGSNLKQSAPDYLKAHPELKSEIQIKDREDEDFNRKLSSPNGKERRR